MYTSTHNLCDEMSYLFCVCEDVKGMLGSDESFGDLMELEFAFSGAEREKRRQSGKTALTSQNDILCWDAALSQSRRVLSPWHRVSGELVLQKICEACSPVLLVSGMSEMWGHIRELVSNTAWFPSRIEGVARHRRHSISESCRESRGLAGLFVRDDRSGVSSPDTNDSDHVCFLHSCHKP